MWARRKVDDNQKEIVSALRKAGREVICLHTIGKGVPDLLVSNPEDMFLIEVKGKKGSLTKDQLEFHKLWKGKRILIVSDPEEAIKVTS